MNVDLNLKTHQEICSSFVALHFEDFKLYILLRLLFLLKQKPRRKCFKNVWSTGSIAQMIPSTHFFRIGLSLLFPYEKFQYHARSNPLLFRATLYKHILSTFRKWKNPHQSMCSQLFPTWKPIPRVSVSYAMHNSNDAS